MKARKRMTPEDMQEWFFEEATSMVQDSLCVFFIAMNEELGIGKDRAERVVERYHSLNSRLNEYDDVKRDIEIRGRLEQMKLGSIAEAFGVKYTFKKYLHEKKKANEVSVVEAANMQKQLKLMKELVNRK